MGKIVIGLIAIAFVVGFGMSGSFTGKQNIVAQINNEKITTKEFVDYSEPANTWIAERDYEEPQLVFDSDRVIIEEFVDNVRFTKDKAGFQTDDPRFNPDDLPEFKHGGLAKILEV